MSMQPALRQMPGKPGRAGVAHGEAGCDSASDEGGCPRHATENTGSALLQAALTRENLQRAFKRVLANKGSAGLDGLDIDQTARHLATQWPVIREQLLSGTYRPSAVRRVTIPKPDGGQRELGIPTVTDRLIQQALLQPIVDPVAGLDKSPAVLLPATPSSSLAIASAAHVAGIRWLATALRCTESSDTMTTMASRARPENPIARETR